MPTKVTFESFRNITVERDCLESSALALKSSALAEKRHYEVIEIKNQGNAGHKTKDDRAFLEWF